jgi:hypothetical protein
MDAENTGSEDADEPDLADDAHVFRPHSRTRVVVRYALLAVLAAIGVAAVVVAIMLPALHLGRHSRPTAPRSAALVYRHPIVLAPPLNGLARFDFGPIGIEYQV